MPHSGFSRPVRGFLALLGASLCTLWAIAPAQAIPSFARQTGQECAACHTAFPELTPFGRAFKLNGYTMGGGDSKIPPFSMMDQATFTNYAKKLDAPIGGGRLRSR